MDCHICTNAFSSDPHSDRAPIGSSSSCIHVICRDCIQKMYLKILEEGRRNLWMSCPLCKIEKSFHGHAEKQNVQHSFCELIGHIAEIRNNNAREREENSIGVPGGKMELEKVEEDSVEPKVEHVSETVIMGDTIHHHGGENKVYKNVKVDEPLTGTAEKVETNSGDGIICKVGSNVKCADDVGGEDAERLHQQHQSKKIKLVEDADGWHNDNAGTNVCESGMSSNQTLLPKHASKPFFDKDNKTCADDDNVGDDDDDNHGDDDDDDDDDNHGDDDDDDDDDDDYDYDDYDDDDYNDDDHDDDNDDADDDDEEEEEEDNNDKDNDNSDANDEIDSDDDIKVLHDTSVGPSKIKIELFNKLACRSVSNTKKERDRRISERKKWLTTADGEPRKTFLRGCQKSTITTVLGGTAMDPAPISCIENSRNMSLFGSISNPFIKKGEFYFAGRADWNPWTPLFPGDVGFIESWCLFGKQSYKDKDTKQRVTVNRSHQEKFHLFLHCAQKRHEPHYYGPDAAGYRLYLGRWRAVPHDDDAELQEVERSFPYEALTWESKFTMADVFKKYCDKNVEYHYKWTDIDGNQHSVTTRTLQENNGKYYKSARERAENEETGLWLKLSTEKRTTRAWIEMLLDRGYRMHIAPVEYIDYDEDLYQKLVEVGAAKGHVTLNDDELGPI